MSSRYKRKGRTKFLMLEKHLLGCPAWRALSPNDRALYLELKWRYDGRNNGRIGLSVREACEALNIGNGAVKAAFLELQAKGFIAVAFKGAFNVKSKRATEWTLAEYDDDRTNQPASKAFMRWRPDGATTGWLQQPKNDDDEKFTGRFQQPTGRFPQRSIGKNTQKKPSRSDFSNRKAYFAPDHGAISATHIIIPYEGKAKETGTSSKGDRQKALPSASPKPLSERKADFGRRGKKIRPEKPP